MSGRMSGEALPARAHRLAVKICGVTRPEDARAAVALGVDLIGLNFFPGSPRYLDLAKARAVRAAVGDSCGVVGVFVNAPPEEVTRIDRALGLDLLQFHGDEPLAALRPFAPRALRVLRPERALEAADLELFSGLWGLVFDAPPPLEGVDSYGGSGRSWHYQRVAACLRGREPEAAPRALLAGGLRPDTVRAVALELTGLWGLDVCSGVESAPGLKDAALMAALVEQLALAAEDTIDRGLSPGNVAEPVSTPRG
jgi:phosphoribosylanthranilate isomerase